MNNITSIKEKQIDDLKIICKSIGIEYSSIDALLKATRIKKLQKRNHYIQQNIGVEIEKSLDNENK